MLTGVVEVFVGVNIAIGAGRFVYGLASMVEETCLPHFRDKYRRDCERPQVDTTNEIRV